MSTRIDGDHGQHRFFHSMVVMGGALALGCGGMSTADEPDRTASGGSGGGGSGGGGSGGTGGSGSTGGSVSGSGGTGIVIKPEDTAGRGPVEPGPFTCSPAHWTCSTYLGCSGEGYQLPEDCACDTSRPEVPSDCPTGETIVCRRATATSDGRPLTQPVNFQCSCQEKQPTCDAACDLAFADRGSCHEDTDPTGNSVLCGCAVIVLR
jgi:hypothetical protein